MCIILLLHVTTSNMRPSFSCIKTSVQVTFCKFYFHFFHCDNDGVIHWLFGVIS